ncbi:hypothetical protein C450_04698 [Halococcus salifodinae DSM 8989]|uniref:Uncharacterized protein n=1 Tax=Halococcus salifodinae DSM 8989 TaxID=1227456 RepID=M0NB77_9EURY|nr:hypothetical protein C450_04698 [Halococcus salifodinae DSM 8989]
MVRETIIGPFSIPDSIKRAFTKIGVIQSVPVQYRFEVVFSSRIDIYIRVFGYYVENQFEQVVFVRIVSAENFRKSAIQLRLG